MPVRYLEQPPPAPLAPWVECVWTVESAEAIPAYGVAPDGCLDIISSSEGLRVVGAMTVERRYDFAGPTRICGLRFRPGMAGDFLEAPPAELTNQELPLEDLWGSPARALADRIAGAPSLTAAAAELARALRPPETGPDPVAKAIAAMAAAHGDVDVDAVASHANLSPRQFRRRCLEAAGLTPKHLCRILRFRHAAGLAACAPGLPWALIAADAGYFDQAHLIRDFREFTGRSPMAVFSKTPPADAR
jgi:AraC-like DNA-binding protein